MLLTGTTVQHQAGVFQTDAPGVFAAAGQLVTVATGVGVKTGTEYRLRIRDATANHSSASSVGIVTLREQMVSRGPADNFFLVSTTIVIMDPSGERHVEYHVEDSGCVG